MTETIVDLRALAVRLRDSGDLISRTLEVLAL
jgi:hypothetical protein